MGFPDIPCLSATSAPYYCTLDDTPYFLHWAAWWNKSIVRADDRTVIERILRHLGLWEQGVRVAPARAPPELVERVIVPWLDDPFPDYDTEPVYLSSEALA